jgi:hypothetical protein
MLHRTVHGMICPIVLGNLDEVQITAFEHLLGSGTVYPYVLVPHAYQNVLS